MSNPHCTSSRKSTIRNTQSAIGFVPIRLNTMPGRKWLLAAFLLLALTLGIRHSQDAKPPRPPSDVLVIHDSLPGPLPSGLVDGNNVLDLLGHFGLKGDLVSLEEYKAGDIARYRFIIVLGVDDRNPRYPLHLLADARAASMPIFWIFKHVDELLSDPSFAAKLGFRT